MSATRTSPDQHITPVIAADNSSPDRQPRQDSRLASGDFGRSAKSPTVAARVKLRILRRRETQHDCGLSRSALYRLIAQGDFPSPVRLSANAVGWLESDVQAWIEQRVADSGARSNAAAKAPTGKKG